MEMGKKHYQILVGGNFEMCDYRKTVDVVCTREELEAVVRPMIAYVRSTGCGCYCVAKEGDGVSNSDFDIMLADCM